jgi:hypothetical protein
MNNFTQKPKILPCDNNLKIIPIIENVDEKGGPAVCYGMTGGKAIER